MTIVFCILDHTPAGGTERTLSLQANHFATHGHEVHIVTTETPALPTPAYPFDSHIHFHALEIHYRDVDGGRTPGKIIARLCKGHLHQQRLFQLLAEIHPDVTVSLFEHETTFLYRSPEQSVKVVQYHFSRYSRRIENQHWPWWKRCFDNFKERRKQRCLNHYDAFVVLTRRDAAQWTEVRHVFALPNALPFYPESVPVERPKTVIAVGRLAVQKGYDHLLHAWSLVSPSHSNWQLHIYGTGTEQASMERQIADLHLTESVHIFPPTPHIDERYQQASLLALTSQYEGFGMVLAEAMACGVPCVSFDTPCGPAEIIRDGEDGYVVPLNDDDALASRLTLLMDDDNLRLNMSQHARLNILRYTPAIVMAQWEELYNRLIQQKR
jgi:glycosyltransferase involved in cell wall biosynthesis